MSVIVYVNSNEADSADSEAVSTALHTEAM